MCCTPETGNCTNCKYSIDGDWTCYSPLIRLYPPQDAEWEPRDISKEHQND